MDLTEVGTVTAGDAPAGYVRTIDLLGALSLAADLASGLSTGHAVRATYAGMRIAADIGLPAEQLRDLFYTELLMDAGCTAWTGQVAASILGDDIVARRELFFFTDPGDPRSVLRWLGRYMAAGEGLGTRVTHAVRFAVHGKAFMTEGMQNTCDVAARLARRLGMSIGVQEALRFAFEQWDGSGPRARHAEGIPIISRIVYATIFLEVFHQVGGRAAAVELARTRRGKALDPVVSDAVGRLAVDEGFWQGLESDSVWTLVRGMEPDSPYRYFRETRLDEAAEAFADFADLKSFYLAGHSQRVAALAQRMASLLGSSPADLVTVRRAALLHDVGLVAVPSFILQKPEDRLTDVEREALRLHPYHAERILARVPAFASAVPLVGAHHERPDVRGYYRGLAYEQIPLGARVIAVADRFDELTHAGPEQQALGVEPALGRMRGEVGFGLCPEAFSALLRSLNVPAPEPLAAGTAHEPGPAAGPKPPWPEGLTDREIEVLRLLATGASRRAMAAALSVSEHTIRHHLSHIYEKIGVHTRVEATLFAIERALLQ